MNRLYNYTYSVTTATAQLERDQQQHPKEHKITANMAAAGSNIQPSCRLYTM